MLRPSLDPSAVAVAVAVAIPAAAGSRLLVGGAEISETWGPVVGEGTAVGSGVGGGSGSDSGPMHPFDLSVEFNLVTLVDDILASVKNVQVW